MEKFIHISPQQAHEMVVNDSVQAVDVRNRDAFIKGHLPHAFHLTDETVEKFLVDADKAKPVICYCYHGFSSQSAADFLVSQGFKKVYSMDGGYEEYKKSYPQS